MILPRTLASFLLGVAVSYIRLDGWERLQKDYIGLQGGANCQTIKYERGKIVELEHVL